MSGHEWDELMRRLDEETRDAVLRATEHRRMVEAHAAALLQRPQSVQTAPKRRKVRVPPPGVSHPIVANSDQEAIFELLYSVARDPMPGKLDLRGACVFYNANDDRTAGGLEIAMYHRSQRIQKRFRHEVRALGKGCSVCGEHFTPGRSTQHRCPDCIAARKKRGAK